VSDKARKHQEFLGQEPIGKLLSKLSIPATIGMMVNAFYNLVDTIFIGRGVGPDAIGGLSIALPAQMIVMAIGIAIGTGAASIVSRNLGAQNPERANLGAGNAFGLALVMGITITVLGLIFIEPLLLIMGASETLFPLAYDYMSVIILGAPFIAFAMVSNNLLRAEGNAKMAMVSMLIGTVLNIILDPLFIFVFKMGIRGAAIATVISQIASFLFVFFHFLLGKSSINFGLKYMKPDLSILKETFVLGFPAFARQSGQSLVTILVNNLLSLYGGDVYISAMGVFNRLILFLFMPLFGMVQGFQPIAGFNYGAKQYKRVKEVLWLSIKIATAYMTVGFIMMFFFPQVMTRIFTSNQELITVASQVIRRLCIFLPFVGFQIVGSAYFQSVGKGIPSLFLNLSRQFLFLIPLLLILPVFFELQGLLWSFPIADALATIVTMIWLSWEVTHLRKQTV